ncbi:MAG: hypothetical protein JRH15_09230 [Deltaproteobacteria bacterium]|nr:hypothetical protein [Deltaproteobacteria bacterium]
MKSLAIVALANMIGIGGLFADTTWAEEAEYDDYMLEEVVVSARKQDENLQDVPISITAINSEVLEQQNVSLLDEAMFTMPNVMTTGGGQYNKLFDILAALKRRGFLYGKSRQKR